MDRLGKEGWECYAVTKGFTYPTDIEPEKTHRVIYYFKRPFDPNRGTEKYL